jgi:hypothetical protein
MSALTAFLANIKNILDQAELFNVSKQGISLDLKNLFQDSELHGDSVVKKSFTTAANGNLSGIPTSSKNLKQWGPCHG